MTCRSSGVFSGPIFFSLHFFLFSSFYAVGSSEIPCRGRFSFSRRPQSFNRHQAVEQKSKHHDDYELTREALAGDRRARSELSRRLVCISPFLLSLNRRVGRPFAREELVDTAQDIMVLILGKLETYAGEAALETWVHRFCSYELMNAVRRKDRQRERLRELPDEYPTKSSEGGPLEQGDKRFVTLLAHLTTREAEVVELRHVDDLKLERVAELLGVSLNTVKTHYYRALKKLRVILAPCSKGGER